MTDKMPAVKVPVTVTNEGVAKGLRDTEAKVKASAERIARTRATMGPGLGALGGGPLGGILGGAFGGEAAMGGIAVGGGLAAFLSLTRAFDAMVEAATGAGEAFKKFQATGELAVGMNSAVLETLARFEARNKPEPGAPGFGAGLVFGTGGQRTMLEEFGREAKKYPAMFGAYFGKLFTAEGTLTEKVGQALAAGYAAVAPEGQAQYLQALMNDPRRRGDLHATFTEFMDTPRSDATTRELKRINRNLS